MRVIMHKKRGINCREEEEEQRERAAIDLLKRCTVPIALTVRRRRSGRTRQREWKIRSKGTRPRFWCSSQTRQNG